MSARLRPLVEILYFDGCPNHEPAVALVERIDRELGTRAEVRLVNVPDREAANRLRFLGSPTIRVDGVDVDPCTEERKDYALSCRIFTTEHGPAGQPEERWVREALATAATVDPAVVARAHEAAAIPASRRGRERSARLNDGERALYRWVIQWFALATPPSAAQIVEQAQTLGLDANTALAALAREDLVHTDEGGDVRVAYPLSARSRGHEVTIEGRGRRRCARSTRSGSPRCSTRRSRSARTTRSAAARSTCTPTSTASPAGSRRRRSCSQGAALAKDQATAGCCDVLNFFDSTENAERYLRENTEVAGMPISIVEAAAAGRAIFSEILKDQ